MFTYMCSMGALRAKSWAEVDAFHAQALAHGGSSEGAPGRPRAHACGPQAGGGAQRFTECP